VSLLQDVDATAGLTLKVKQEPFPTSGGLIHGKHRHVSEPDVHLAPEKYGKEQRGSGWVYTQLWVERAWRSLTKAILLSLSPLVGCIKSTAHSAGNGDMQ
jgi:hypothetical protein